MITFSAEFALIEEYEYEEEEEYEDDPFAEAVYTAMIEFYRQRFHNQGPPVMQMRGGPLEQASLMLHAIERGEPIRHDEVLNDPDVLY